MVNLLIIQYRFGYFYSVLIFLNQRKEKVKYFSIPLQPAKQHLVNYYRSVDCTNLANYTVFQAQIILTLVYQCSENIQ